MPAWVAGEHFLKIWAAYSEHNFVGMQQFTITGQCYIHQIAALKQIVKTGRYIFLYWSNRRDVDYELFLA